MKPAPPPPPPVETHYVATELQSRSLTWERASIALDQAWDTKKAQTARTGELVDRYEVSVQLAGPLVSQAELQRLVDLTSRYGHENFEFTRSFPLHRGEIESAFGVALTKALAGRADLHECGPVSDAIWTLNRGLRPAEGCTGRDVTLDIVGAVDADSELNAAIGRIVGDTWKPVVYEPEAQPVATPRWIDVYAFIDAGAHDRLVELDAREKAALKDQASTARAAADTLANDLVRGKSSDVKKRIKEIQDPVERIRAQTVADRRTLAAAPLAAGEEALRSWAKRGEPSVSFCVNPPELGGCTGEDATAELVPRLLAEKRVADAFVVKE